MTNYEWIKTVATKQEILSLFCAAAFPFMEDYPNSAKYMLKKEYEKFLDEQYTDEND